MTYIDKPLDPARIAEIKPILDLILGHGYIAGSYAATLAVEPNIPTFKAGDIDIFATTHNRAHTIALTLHALSGSNLPLILEGIYYKVMNPFGVLPINVIVPKTHWIGNILPDKILDSFDFDVCSAAIYANGSYVRCLPQAGSMTAQVLRIFEPMRTFQRMLKYAAKGVVFPKDEIRKIMYATRAILHDSSRYDDQGYPTNFNSWDSDQPIDLTSLKTDLILPIDK